jgi:Prokaryotic Cytochrome C oxidase subunit IV
MTWLFKSRNAAVWLLLVVLTLFSWESSVMSGSRPVIATGVLLIAFFKVRIIGLEFMELRTAPLPLRIAFEVWIVGVCAVLLTLYWQAAK